MATKKLTEKKSTDTKEEKIVKKSSYSKKKKVKKNIPNGIAFVQSTFNNTIVSIADINGNVISGGIIFERGGLFPTTVGAFQSFNRGGDTDILLYKLDSLGS